MENLNLDLTKRIQETMTKLRGNQEDKNWEIKEGLETEKSWEERQNKEIQNLDNLMSQATKEDLVAIITKRAYDGQYSEESIYSY